jgi:hypothetical protein
MATSMRGLVENFLLVVISGLLDDRNRYYVDNVTSVTNVRLVRWRIEPVTSQHPAVGNTSVEGWKPVNP